LLYRRRTRARHPVINYIFIHRFKNENNPTVNRITHSFQNLKFSHNHFIHCPLTEKNYFPLPVLIKLTINWSNKIQSMKVFICGPPRVNWDWEEKFSKVKKFNISVFRRRFVLNWRAKGSEQQLVGAEQSSSILTSSTYINIHNIFIDGWFYGSLQIIPADVQMLIFSLNVENTNTCSQKEEARMRLLWLWISMRKLGSSSGDGWKAGRSSLVTPLYDSRALISE